MAIMRYGFYAVNFGAAYLKTRYVSLCKTTMPAYTASLRIPLETVEDAAIRTHNASIVGATFLPTPPIRYPPGMAATADLTVQYRPVFFGADREYAEDEGWQTVHGSIGARPLYHRKNRKNRKWREVENPLFAELPKH